MPDFRKLTLDDRSWIEPLTRAANFRCADYCFTNMYVWQDAYDLCAARVNDRIAVRLCGMSGNGVARYSFPVGTGDLYPVVEELRADAASHGCEMVMRGIPASELDTLRELYPSIEFTYSEDESDYVYLAEKLATLAGKKLHAKRNHINRFTETHDWSYEPITQDNLNEVIEMNERWMEHNFLEKNRMYLGEKQALSHVFADFDKLGLEGGLLRADGEVIAYTLGEKLSSDTYVMHFEKAFAEIQGAYAMINRENVKRVLTLHPEIVYINREEDLGLEGLRKAKQSYYPDMMAEKYTASWGK